MKNSNLCIGIVVGTINDGAGGIAPAIMGYTNVIAEMQIYSHLLTINYPELGNLISIDSVELHSYLANFFARKFGGFNLKLQKELWQLAAKKLDLIHSYGIWQLHNLYARQSSIGNNIPLIISPEGMLEPWCLRFSGFKKK
ncbi:putative glycosyltransferase [Nostoc sp. NIES-4103]|nr:putative glycosyltransferase [Nostoc sp. NIES-4103]